MNNATMAVERRAGMEQLKADVARIEAVTDRLNRAVFGDPDHPKEMPGMIHELSAVDKEVRKTNGILARIMWLVLSGVVLAILNLIIRIPS